MQKQALAHYESLNLHGEVAGIGLEALIRMVTEQWGWIVTLEDGRILADENKPECVCPHREGADGTLCACSEAFAAHLFSEATGRLARATVVESVLRGGHHCVYAIRLEE